MAKEKEFKDTHNIQELTPIEIRFLNLLKKKEKYHIPLTKAEKEVLGEDSE